MLSFLLQPIVENAIVHGVDQRPEGGGRIRIATQLDGAVMRFCIQDDGPGFALGKDGQLAPIVQILSSEFIISTAGNGACDMPICQMAVSL